MDFISWLVVGALFMLAEFGMGKFYLLAIGLACIYASIASYTGASTGLQMAVFGLGSIAHVLAVISLRKLFKSSGSPANIPSDIGQRVEVIEWLDECSARVTYQDKEWMADKVKAEMPDAAHGIIKSVQGNRLIITTDQPTPQITTSPNA